MALIRLCGFLALLALQVPVWASESVQSIGTPLMIGQRMIHVFRVPFGVFSPQERAEGARKRIEQVLEQPGEGWTSAKHTEQGIQIELDGKALFLVLPGDVNPLAGETADDLAIQATRTLQKVWSEARERNDPHAFLVSLVRVATATLVMLTAAFAIARLQSRVSAAATRMIAQRVHVMTESRLLRGWIRRLPKWIGRFMILVSWVVGLLLAYAYLTYSLAQFVLTRAAGERLSSSLASMVGEAMLAMAGSLPGVFVAVLIFLLTWLATRLATEFFVSVESRPIGSAQINTHTAPTTRRIFNTLLWLFAIAMAYPYLPGSHTEAFKGLTVIVGLMASIGASGIVGQIASGVMIVYTYALTKGEYVRIQEYEGTVTEIGLFETRLRTGLGEEISLPNAYVLGNVIRNFSRVQDGNCSVIDTQITIGYDTPWRQVHALLHEASARIPEVLNEPPIQIVQSALSDFYVEYKLVVYVDTRVPATRARITSDLNAAILDSFNRHSVQIMSPHYQHDPAQPKVVPESDWYPAPENR